MKTYDKSLNDFTKLMYAEEYFEFFGIEYDASLISVKRFHILKEYSKLIKNGFEHFKNDENGLLDFLKFSLLRVYGEFKNGYAPSAAVVWDMFKDGKLSGCASCTPSQGNSCGC